MLQVGNSKNIVEKQSERVRVWWQRNNRVCYNSQGEKRLQLQLRKGHWEREEKTETFLR